MSTTPLPEEVTKSAQVQELEKIYQMTLQEKIETYAKIMISVAEELDEKIADSGVKNQIFKALLYQVFGIDF